MKSFNTPPLPGGGGGEGMSPFCPILSLEVGGGGGVTKHDIFRGGGGVTTIHNDTFL